MTTPTQHDVIVVGAGNAALCAALAAREQGASVLVVEVAPKHERGGNSYFTGGVFRMVYHGLDDIVAVIPDMTDAERESIEVGSYTEDDFYNDMMRITKDMADQDLVDILINNSHDGVRWLHQKGVRWVPLWGRQAFKIGGKFRFFGGVVIEPVGGGVGLIDQLCDIAERSEIEIRYETKGWKLITDDRGKVTGLTVKTPNGFEYLPAGAVVLACGGFEANSEMRARYLGPGWDLAKVRGTQYNVGDGIRMALEIGAMPHGNWSGCHAVAWDLNAPPYGDRKITDLFQKHSYPFGLIVNVDGNRFVDEGKDIRNYTYAEYGKEILKQPQMTAFQLFDQKTVHLLRDEYRIREVTKAQEDTVGALAKKLGINPHGLEQTVAQFNAACQPGEYNPTIRDGVHTEGITPPKSNWALPLDTPPYLGFAVTCGITFTFGGLKISHSAEVLDTEDRPIPGLYAAGELVGGLFYNNYPGGTGLMTGTVFGRIAGESAGKVTAASKAKA